MDYSRFSSTLLSSSLSYGRNGVWWSAPSSLCPQASHPDRKHDKLNNQNFLSIQARFLPESYEEVSRKSEVVSRRNVLSLMSSLLAATAATSSVNAKPLPMMEEPDLPSFRKTSSGVKIQEVVNGSGPEAKTGDILEFNFVCRRSNGYFVYSTVDQFNDQSQPAVLPLGVGKIIPGLEEVLAGMRPGGKRRALVPPEVGYTDTFLEPQPHEFGPRRSLMAHAKEPLVFEVQLLKIR